MLDAFQSDVEFADQHWFSLSKIPVLLILDLIQGALVRIEFASRIPCLQVRFQLSKV
jgi:hypothetical protein